MGPNIVLLVVVAALSAAQAKVTEYGQQTERGVSRVAFWDNENNRSLGQAAIDYGRPVWKADYEGQLDAMTSGKMWRMGGNFWTTPDVNIPLTVGSVEIPVGYYYLAVKRSEDGAQWSLAFVDPTEARNKAIDPFEVGTRASEVPIRFEVPLSFEARDTPRERLAIDLSEVRLAIEWGTFALSAPISVTHR